MATQAQIEAARRNGAKSKGPVTDAGKERSSANATRHGLSAKHIIVLSNESNEGFLKLVARFEEMFQPVDDIERGFVRQAAAARWRLLRASVIETSLFDLQMADDMAEVRQMYPNADVDEGIRLAVAFKKMTADRTLEMAGRYETRLSREYERAIRGLDRVRAERKQREAAAESAADKEIRQNEPELTPPAAAAEPEPVKIQNEPKADSETHPRPAASPHAAVEKLQNEPKTDFAVRPPEKPLAA